MVQTGLLGVIPFILAFATAWLFIIRALRDRRLLPRTHHVLIVEAAGVLAFFTVLGVVQSSGALYGVDWLLLAPLFAYIAAIDRLRKGAKAGAAVHQAPPAERSNEQ